MLLWDACRFIVGIVRRISSTFRSRRSCASPIDRCLSPIDFTEARSSCCHAGGLLRDSFPRTASGYAKRLCKECIEGNMRSQACGWGSSKGSGRVSSPSSGLLVCKEGWLGSLKGSASKGAFSLPSGICEHPVAQSQLPGLTFGGPHSARLVNRRMK